MKNVMQVAFKPRVIFVMFFFLAMSYIYIDRPIAEYFYALNLKLNWPWLTWITHLGLGEYYFVLFLFLFVFFRFVYINPQQLARVIFLLLCLAIPDAICITLKVILGRARPELWFSGQLYGFYGYHLNPVYWSFPSGHTTSIFGLVFGLCIVFPRYCMGFLLLGFMVALSRILLTNHYLSDVIMASYLTLAEITLVLFILRQKNWLKSAWAVAVKE